MRLLWDVSQDPTCSLVIKIRAQLYMPTSNVELLACVSPKGCDQSATTLRFEFDTSSTNSTWLPGLQDALVEISFFYSALKQALTPPPCPMLKLHRINFHRIVSI